MSSPLTHGGRGADEAFTLIELLTVIAIIGILAAITFGVVKGVQTRALISQSRSELSAIATALEGYKRQYGDYPQMLAKPAYSDNANTLIGTISTATVADGPGILFNALSGKRGPAGDAILGKSFLELSKFTVQETAVANQPDNTSTNKANALLDPWGRRYLYYYKISATDASTTAAAARPWKQPSYILLSAGATVATDGNPGITVNADGSIAVSSAAEEADNIYANR